MHDLQLLWSSIYLYSAFVCLWVGGEDVLLPNSHVMCCHLAGNLERIILFRVDQVVITGLNGRIKGFSNRLSSLLKLKIKCIPRFFFKEESIGKRIAISIVPISP